MSLRSRPEKTAHRTRARHGATTVELAFCLPVLLLLLFGCYEFARANMMRHAVQAAAYEGARVGITPGATVEDVEEAVDFMLSTVGVREFDIEVTPNPIELRAPRVNVGITVRMVENSSLPAFFTRSIEMEGNCELVRESGF